MKTLYLERSTGESRSGAWAEELVLKNVSRIVVGTGPGSFAGIRSVLAFAKGYQLGTSCEVLGLPSPCAIVGTLRENPATPRRLAVIGDARQGKRWIALFNGYSLERPVFQLFSQDLLGPVPNATGTVATKRAEADSDACLALSLVEAVVTPDAKRIGAELSSAFGARYLGEVMPTAEGLRAFAEANPNALERNPLPLYLNPAVRT